MIGSYVVRIYWGDLKRKVEIMKLFKFHHKLLDMHLAYCIFFTSLDFFKVFLKSLLLTSPLVHLQYVKDLKVV